MLAVRLRHHAAPVATRDESDPFGDVVLAFSAATGVMLAFIDAALGNGLAVAVPSAVIVLGHVAGVRRLAIVAAFAVWLRVLAMSGDAGPATPIVMLALCALLVVGPGRALEWLEWRWTDRREDARGEAIGGAHAGEDVGWIEELPDGRC